jgi:HPt (histidine-containing phosphotransfer) domain-containing protein
VTRTGDTTTSQFSQQELAVRFLERTQIEISQMSECLPEESIALDPPAVAQIERMAHKISGASESFGFPEISAIAAAIELLAHGSNARTVGERLVLHTRLTDQISALEVYVQFELAERSPKVPARGGVYVSVGEDDIYLLPTALRR